MRRRTLGVEEEVLLVDGMTGLPVPVAPEVLTAMKMRPVPFGVAAEMHQEMLELISVPHRLLSSLEADLCAARLFADSVARDAGARVAPLAISPLGGPPHPSDDPRYARIVERYGVTSLRCMTCGMHVHVSIASAAEGVAILDRIRVWLPVLRALSANSPYSAGVDTGYDSYRFSQWSSWPSSGPAEVYGDVRAYRRSTAEALETGVLLDEGMLYADARLSSRFPTVEIRVSDVQLTADATTTIAGLVRALVSSAAEAARRGEPAPTCSAAALRLAGWQASLNGLRGDLVDPRCGRPAPAADVVDALLAFAEPGLQAHADARRVRAGIDRLMTQGNGAAWQRRTLLRAGTMSAMVLAAADAAAEEASRVPVFPVARTA